MAWEDCVVDLHSVKLSQNTLESMFSKCGAVRSVIHWKGQGEKQHVFMEYKTPGAAESARVIGLDRNDLQVIKLSNNEMLKRKFRELEKQSANRSRSTCFYSERSVDVKVNSARDCSLPAKPVTSPTDAEKRGATYGTLDSERSIRRAPSRPSSASHSTPSSRASRAPGRSELFQGESSRTSSMDNLKDPLPPPHNLTLARCPTETDASDSRSTRLTVTNGDCGVSGVNNVFSITPASSPSKIPGEASIGPKSMLKKSDTCPTVLEIPHAGEIIKFDLDTQLEPDPAGIISMLGTVKADQKLWMMTAAHYNGKHNLKAAREVLQAGIDTAVQAGMEADTKPFWHLLTQINSSLNASSSVCSSKQKSGNNRPGNMDKPINVYSHSVKERANFSGVPDDTNYVSSPAKDVLHSSPEIGSMSSIKTPSLIHQSSASFQHTHVRPTVPNGGESHPSTRHAPPTPLPVALDISAKLHSLQSEIDALRAKHNSALEDLSFMRSSKRRAEDEVKEERSIRRKLEKHLRTAEDALTRSKRMEDAALDQVKREVEARRKAEELLVLIRADKDGAGGTSFFAHPSANDAAMLFQLASMIRGILSGDLSNSWQSSIGTAIGVASSTAGSQPET